MIGVIWGYIRFRVSPNVGYFFGSPRDEDYSILDLYSSTLGSPLFGKSACVGSKLRFHFVDWGVIGIWFMV